MPGVVKSLTVALAFAALFQLPEALLAQQQEPDAKAAQANPIQAKPTDGDAAPSEIRIGNVMPYTGALAAFGSIGRTKSAYFDMINDHGGINGRKIKFISYDSSSDAVTSFKLTHRLLDEDKVLLLFGSFALPGDLALRPYLNQHRVPDLFVASGTADGAIRIAIPGRWVGSRHFARRAGFMPTTSRPPIRRARLPLSGRTISSGGICSWVCRKVSATSHT